MRLPFKARIPLEGTPEAATAGAIHGPNLLMMLDMTESSLETPTPTPDTPAPTQVVDHSAFPVRQDLYDEGYSEEEYEQMLQLYEGTLQSIQEGEIVKSKVLRVTDSHVILDVGFKSEGAVSIDEFKDPATIEPGQEVEVLLERLEDEEGSIVLSKKKADFMRVWEKIRHAHENDEPVRGTLQKKIKGGVVVDLMGVDAFLPGSQIALRRVPNIDELLGQSFDFKIIKLNKRRRNIVVSRRVILEAERAHKREFLMKELQVDQVRKGVVKNITDFGAFIDLGGVDGLLHITDMSWGRVSHPSRSRCSTSTGTASGFRSGSSSCTPIRGRRCRSATPWARGCRARSSASPTTARSWSWSPESRGWCISAR